MLKAPEPDCSGEFNQVDEDEGYRTFGGCLQAAAVCLNFISQNQWVIIETKEINCS